MTQLTTPPQKVSPLASSRIWTVPADRATVKPNPDAGKTAWRVPGRVIPVTAPDGTVWNMRQIETLYSIVPSPNYNYDHVDCTFDCGCPDGVRLSELRNEDCTRSFYAGECPRCYNVIMYDYEKLPDDVCATLAQIVMPVLEPFVPPELSLLDEITAARDKMLNACGIPAELLKDQGTINEAIHSTPLLLQSPRPGTDPNR